MADFVKVARAADIASGEGKVVEAGGKKIAIFNIDGTFYAIDDTCTHRGGPLSEGMVVGKEVICPWHGAVFDVTSGAVLGAPAPASFIVRRHSGQGNLLRDNTSWRGGLNVDAKVKLYSQEKLALLPES